MAVSKMAGTSARITWKIGCFPVLAATLAMLAWLTERWTYFVMKEERYVFVHSLFVMACIAIAISIALQSWLSLKHSTSRQTVTIGAVFIGAAIFDTFHLLTDQGIAQYGTALNSATWTWYTARFVESIGLLAAVTIPNRPAEQSFRRLLFTGFILFSTIFLLLILGILPGFPAIFVTYSDQMPLNMSTERISVVIKVLAIAILLYTSGFNSTSKLLIWPLSMLVLSGFMFMKNMQAYDSYNLYGHLFKLVGYYGIMKAVYVTTVKQPYLAQHHIQQQLVEHKQQIEESERRYRHLALHDELTGLPNRRWFMEGVRDAISQRPDAKYALLLFDIDRFKAINDTMGHSFGDSLLRALAAKLDRFCADKGMLARLGGDEFAILLLNTSGWNEIQQFGQSLIEQLEAPCRIRDHEFRLSGSTGVALYPQDSDNYESLLKHAEIAMYHAKERRSKLALYSEEMQVNQAHVAMESDLRSALDKGEFLLHYQPRINIASGRVAGAEALLRWRHPEHGLIPPAEFIPVAEQTGMIVPIGEWVLEQACKQWAQWHQLGIAPPSIAVNLSNVQFNEDKLVDMIARIMKSTAVPKGVLVLEITESIAMDIGLATAKINQLKDLGVSIDIDDFGTGYSSLSYLKQLPIDRLKIDRSFVRDLSADPGDAAIIASITAMAHHLNIAVVAEGVETEEQLAYLVEHHCDEAQGYWFSPPVSAKQFDQYMRNHIQTYGRDSQ